MTIIERQELERLRQEVEDLRRQQAVYTPLGLVHRWLDSVGVPTCGDNLGKRLQLLGERLNELNLIEKAWSSVIEYYETQGITTATGKWVATTLRARLAGVKKETNAKDVESLSFEEVWKTATMLQERLTREFQEGLLKALNDVGQRMRKGESLTEAACSVEDCKECEADHAASIRDAVEEMREHAEVRNPIRCLYCEQPLTGRFKEHGYGVCVPAPDEEGEGL